jgi:hypothetical protein
VTHVPLEKHYYPVLHAPFCVEMSGDDFTLATILLALHVQVDLLVLTGFSKIISCDPGPGTTEIEIMSKDVSHP